MPLDRRSHKESRLVVCYCCFNKAIKHFKISGKVEQLIKNMFPHFDKTNVCTPLVLCGSCYIKIKKNTLTQVVNYETLKIRLKRNEKQCGCPMCQVARSNPRQNLPLKCTIQKRKVGRPAINNDVIKPKSIKLCSLCNSKLQKGLKHTCTLTTKVANTVTLASGCQQQVASKIIQKEKSVQCSSSLVLNKGKGVGMEIGIKRQHEAPDQQKVTLNVFQEIQKDCNLSLNSMRKISDHLRNVAKKMVEPNVIPNMKKLSHRLDEYFDFEMLNNVKIGKNEFSPAPFVYCNNLPQLTVYLLNERNLGNSFNVKIGIDSGGDSLKVCLNLLPYDNTEVGNKHKSGGINKLMIIGLGPKMIECYSNIELIFKTINFNSLCGVCEYTFAADLKLIMMLLGLQANSSSHPCPWCDVFFKDLEGKGQMRTIHNISEQNILWQKNTDGKLDKVKHFSKLSMLIKSLLIIS